MSDKAIKFGAPPSAYSGERYRTCDYCKTVYTEEQKGFLRWQGNSNIILCRLPACEKAAEEAMIKYLAEFEAKAKFDREMEDY